MSCHASEEALERYSLGKCSEEELDQIDEHLLVCHACQDRAAETDLLMKPMCSALAAEAHPAMYAASRGKPRRKFPSWFAPRSLTWAPALVVLLLTVIVWRNPPFATPLPQRVGLEAFRGAERDVVAHASPNRPIQLLLNLGSLRTSPSYRIEIVSSDRTVEKQGTLAGHSEVTEFDAGPLSTGRYWVRLYDAEGTLLREYGLTVR
jgi:hypothetical protein